MCVLDLVTRIHMCTSKSKSNQSYCPQIRAYVYMLVCTNLVNLADCSKIVSTDFLLINLLRTFMV